MKSDAFVEKYMKKHHFGKKNAIPNNLLARMFGYTDLGTNGRHGIKNSALLTRQIWRLVVGGVPLCCSNRGYYYAASRSETIAPISVLLQLSDLNSGRASALARAAIRAYPQI